MLGIADEKRLDPGRRGIERAQQGASGIDRYLGIGSPVDRDEDPVQADLAQVRRHESPRAGRNEQGRDQGAPRQAFG